MKRLISFLLALIFIIPSGLVSASASEKNKAILGEAAYYSAKEGLFAGSRAVRSTSADTASEQYTFKISGKHNYTYAQQALKLLNEIRAEKGLPKLVMDKDLLEAAMQRAAECAVYYSHTRPDGTRCFSIVDGYAMAMGENIAMGQASPEEVIADWENSPGHYANMVNEVFASVGIGCFEMSSGQLAWVQFFTSGSGEKSSETGVVKETRKITAIKDTAIIRGIVDPDFAANGKKGGKIKIDVFSYYEEGYDYFRQKISSSYFYFYSSNPDVVEIADKTKNYGIMKKNGNIKISVKPQSNTKIKFTSVKQYVHLHKGELQYSGIYTEGCKRISYNEYYCIKCEQYYNKNVVTYDHLSSDWIVDKKATVSAAGKRHKECLRCEELLETEVIPQLLCASPKMKSAKNTASGVKVSWEAVSGADSYRVYRKLSGGSYSLFKKTTSLSITDKTAVGGKKYYYVVKAVNEAGYSSKSNSVSAIRLSEPELLSASRTEKGLKIKWGAVSGAEKYYVYRVKDGKWVKIGETANKYFTDKTAKAGKSYTYTVKAVNAGYCSSYSKEGIKGK